MTVDLDGGSNAIKNLSALEADTVSAKVALYSGDFVAGGGHGTIQLHVGDGSGVGIYAGTTDPSVSGVGLPAGSLYLRRMDANTGQLWFKTGPNATDWVKISP